MIFKIDQACALYDIYLRERHSNFLFKQRQNIFCQMNGLLSTDIKVTTRDPDGKFAINVTSSKAKSKELLKNYDFLDGIEATDLDIAPRDLHTSNINKYLSQDTKNHAKSPLIYDYFWIEKDLFVEVYDVKFPVEFRIEGIRKLNKMEEVFISHLRETSSLVLEML